MHVPYTLYNFLLNIALIPSSEKPNCLQATFALNSGLSLHWSSHTVPQAPPKQTSTLPSDGELPPTSLMSPLKHTACGKYAIYSENSYSINLAIHSLCDTVLQGKSRNTPLSIIDTLISLVAIDRTSHAKKQTCVGIEGGRGRS